ncbi:MAG: SRPBCC family protein [Hyphomicrobiales bacterium]
MDTSFTNETIIDLPRETVVDLYTDVELLGRWQPSFISHKYLSDPTKNELEIAEVCYSFAGRDLVFVRKVLSDNLPETIVATFEVDGIRQIVENKFVVLSENQTKLETNVTISSQSSYIQADFLQVKEAFRVQTTTMQQNFKAFAEAY